MTDSSLRANLGRRSDLFIIVIAAAYLALQILYTVHLPFVMDEFDGAYEAYRLRHAVPYRDFTPYKTVAGYYIQTLGTFAASTVWSRLLALKLQLAVINAVMLAAAAMVLARRIDRASIVAALALLCLCSTFLERSSEIRVDMLTSWAGLWSLIILLRDRPGWAGALAGVSFLISQKGALFIVAGALALAAVVLRDRTKLSMRNAAYYTIACTAAIAMYIALWGISTSFRSVIDATFFGGARAALIQTGGIRLRYWRQIVFRDPAYALITVFALWRTASSRTITICVYAAVLLAQAIAYSQPWPYFFVLIFPTLFVLHAVCFETVPWRTPFVAAIIVLGVVYPLRRVAVVVQRHNDYQQYNVELASGVLDRGDVYVAGNDLVHDREQFPPALARLGSPVIYALRDAPASEVGTIVADLERTPPKLVIGNYRIYNLPLPILDFIAKHYARTTGSVFVYAPYIDRPSQLRIAYGGRYRIESQSPSPITIDGIAHPPNSDVDLAPGLHAVDVHGPLRLRLVPPRINDLLDARYLAEQRMYPNVYDY